MGLFEKFKKLFERQMIVENFALEFPIEVNVKEIHQEFKVDTEDLIEKINELDVKLNSLKMLKTKRVPHKNIKIKDYRFGDLDLPPDLDVVKEYVLSI